MIHGIIKKMKQVSKALLVTGIVFAVAIAGVLFLYMTRVNAETNISATSTDHYAWDDTNGWWDFYSTNTVQVWSTRLEGYASSTVGDISLDCATTRSGNICDSSNYGVCNGAGPHMSDGSCPNGDAQGILSGYAWNDTIGWISLNCDESGHGGSNLCSTSNYKVQIDSNGSFSGYAWNDVAGWISFNCSNNASCDSSNFKVNTSWRATSTVGYLTSSIFDTQSTEGALLNSILWQGTDYPGSTCVDFQIAASNSSGGPWSFIGPDGSDTTYYGASCAVTPNGGVGCSSPDTPVCVNKADFLNQRYLRYKVRLASDFLQTKTPVINNIILNWSP